jgi:hypothetical protein
MVARLTFFEFKIQNSKFKMKKKKNFELINSEYRLPLYFNSVVQQFSGGKKAPTDCNARIYNFEF